MFSRVAIVGVGLIGGSLGLAMRERGFAGTVVGVGRRVAVLQTACDLGAIDRGTPDLAAGVEDADLVVLATPIEQIRADLARLAPLLAPGAIVTDVGSVKRLIVEAGETYLPQNFVGSHPMAGSEKSGVEHARADLFEGATWAVTPTARTPLDFAAQVIALARAVGSNVLELPPDDHDRIVALTSHLPHVLAFALSAQGKDAAAHLPDLMRLAAGSWASATRVAHSSPQLWQEIAIANRSALLAALDDYVAELQQVRAALGDDEANSVLAAFERGHLT